MATVPTQADVVVIGAGIVGNSLVHHLARLGWKPDVTQASSFADARKHGSTHLTDDWRALVSHPEIDIIVESTGDPIAAVEHALEAFRHGKSVVMVTVEADAFCGPLLARRAAESGVIPYPPEFFAQARKRKWKNARLAAFGFTRRKGVAVEQDEQVRMLLDAGTPVITIVGKTWLLHVQEVLRVTPDENLAMIGDTIRFLKDHGKIVVYDAEHSFDGFVDEPDYALATWQAAEKAGAGTARILLAARQNRAPSSATRATAPTRSARRPGCTARSRCISWTTSPPPCPARWRPRTTCGCSP